MNKAQMEEDDELSLSELESNLSKYVSFIDNRLHPDLEKAVKKREEIENEIEEYRQLSKHLTLLEARQRRQNSNTNTNDNNDDENNNDNTTLVDLSKGHELCYCKAKIDQEDKKEGKICVHVGLKADIHIEMTYVEAMSFCRKRIQLLEKDHLRLKANKAKLIASHLESALLLTHTLKEEVEKKKEKILLQEEKIPF